MSFFPLAGADLLRTLKRVRTCERCGGPVNHGGHDAVCIPCVVARKITVGDIPRYGFDAVNLRRLADQVEPYSAGTARLLRNHADS